MNFLIIDSSTGVFLWILQHFYEQLFWQNNSHGCFWKIWVYSIHARLIQGLQQLLFTFFDWKTSTWAYHLLQFFISYWKKFLKLSTQSYLSLLNLFLFLCTFSVFLDDYFFRWLAYKSLLSRSSVLIN